MISPMLDLNTLRNRRFAISLNSLNTLSLILFLWRTGSAPAAGCLAARPTSSNSSVSVQLFQRILKRVKQSL
ncbi:hypothetical protein PSPO01_12865 [Paraphaeosphaeria sporulosa]